LIAVFCAVFGERADKSRREKEKRKESSTMQGLNGLVRSDQREETKE